MQYTCWTLPSLTHMPSYQTHPTINQLAHQLWEGGTVETTTHHTFDDMRIMCDNDPSAGSPTETLLRLHLPLNDKV